MKNIRGIFQEETSVRYKALIVLFAIFIIFPAHVIAGTFQVAPVKMYYSTKNKSETLTITNKGKKLLTTQIEILEWSHDENGKEVLTPTTDMIYFPKILTMEPDVSKIVRIGYKSRLLVEKEKSYRLFVRELPVSKPGEKTTLTFILNISIPVFLPPVKEEYNVNMEKIELSDGALNIHAKNRGNISAKFTNTVITGFDESNVETFSQKVDVWYVLSGLSTKTATKINRDACLKTKRITVSTQIQRSNNRALGPRQEKELIVASDLCPKEPPPPPVPEPKEDSPAIEKEENK